MTISLEEAMGLTPFKPAKRDMFSTSAPEKVSVPSGSLLPSDPEIKQTLLDTAERHKINPAILFALAQQESNYNPEAVGPKTKYGHATGMMQFIPDTAKGHGIDPLDYRQAADAAAKDLAAQIKSRGVEWAIAHHHAGSNPKQHGPLTRQYTQQVLAKAKTIASELDIPFDMVEAAAQLEQAADSDTISLEEALSIRGSESNAPPAPKPKAVAPAEVESLQTTLTRRLARDMAETGIPIPGVASSINALKRSAHRGWEGIKQALNRETVLVDRTDEELKLLYDEAKLDFNSEVVRRGLSFESFADRYRQVRVSAKPFAEEEAEWVERLKTSPQDAYLLPKRLNHLRPMADDTNFAPKDTFTGVVQRIAANVKTPIDLLLQDSLPAAAVTYLATLPELERKKFDTIRQTAQAMQTVRDENASPEQLEQAKPFLADWEERTNPDVIRAWDQLWTAANESPDAVGLALIEALAADPYMVAAPAGSGLIKPIRSLQAARKVGAGTTAGKVGTIADRIIDGAATTATLNVATGAVQNLAEFGRVNDDEVRLNAAIGVLTGAAGNVFFQGARAKTKLANAEAAKAEGVYEQALADAAKADVQMEEVIETALSSKHGVGTETTPLQQLILAMAGDPLHPDPKAIIAQRRKSIKDAFKNESDYADYLSFVVEERLNRAATLATEAEAQAAAKLDAAHGINPEDAAARRAGFAEEYDAAIIARNSAEEAGMMDEARAEMEKAVELNERLSAEELLEATYTEDSSTIEQVEANIARRDAALNTPKRQRGKADPETLARLGVVAGGAAVGATLFPEDEKLKGTILGGLAGLVVPAGGSILTRMRQVGAIASDGQIIAALTKAKKLANSLEESEIRARDNAWITAAKAGDQKSFENLWEAYGKKIERVVQKYVANRESWLAAEAADIAQEAFIKVFTEIQSNPDFNIRESFPAYVTRVAQNEAKMAIRARQSDGRGGGTYKVLNEDVPSARDSYEGESKAGYSLIDRHSDLPDFEVGMEGAYDTPESLAVRDQVFDIMRQELERMPPKVAEAFTLYHLDNYDMKGVAEMMGISQPTASVHIAKAENRIKVAIKNNRLKLGQEPSEVKVPYKQRGEADTEAMVKTAAITSAAIAGGAAGYFFYDGDPWKTGVSALFGGTLGALALGKAGRGKNIALGDLGDANRLSLYLRSIDYRLRDMSPTLYGRAKKHGEAELRDIKKYNDATYSFTQIFDKLPKTIKPVVIRALSTRRKDVVDKVLNFAGGQKFVDAYAPVRKVLDDIEDTLVDLGLIAKTELDYFPFSVKDLDGLRKALGNDVSDKIDQAIKTAEATVKNKSGRALTEIERDIIVNKVLEPYLGKPVQAGRPGFSKARTIQEIPEHLQQYYHDPIAALNSYGVQAIKYIERAKFFGKHLVKKKEGNHEYVNVSDSIGELVNDLKNKGELSDSQAIELAGMLQDRFSGGEMASSPVVSGTKDLVNASLLGHVFAAATQVGDIVQQARLHGWRASTKALVRQAIRAKRLDLRNFGLNEHIGHEFLASGWTRKVADWSFKYGGFRTIDEVGKNFGLNASVERMLQDARSPKGIMRLADRYQRAFPEDFPKALAALKRGEVNESVELLAFTDLTRTQPLTSWELPQMYQRMPNGRLMYHLQTFSLRVLNEVYESAVKDILTTNPKRIVRGAKNLVGIGAILGVQGVLSDKIKDALAGKPLELDWKEIPVNALEALGLSLYDYNRMRDSGPLEGFIESKKPPIFRMSADLLNEPERSSKYIPVLGRPGYEYFRESLESRRKDRRRREGYKVEINVPPKEKDKQRRS